VTSSAWLEELSLAPGPPWLDMGTHGLAGRPWLVADEHHDRDLGWKAELLTERHADVFAALDTPAVAGASAEVLTLVVEATGASPDPDLHPLDAAGRLVQEDLCLLVQRDGGPHLDAATLCFPSYWRLTEKLGRPLAEVHGPVAHYADELATKVDTFLGRLRPERPVRRRNWSIHDDPAYFLPGPLASPGSGPQASPTVAPRPEPPAGLWVRSERQTLRRLRSADVVVFTIRTQQVPLAAVGDHPDVAHRMADAIAAWSPALIAYKGGHGALEAVDWLASR
jgi:hypothetical protein